LHSLAEEVEDPLLDVLQLRDVHGPVRITPGSLLLGQELDRIEDVVEFHFVEGELVFHGSSIPLSPVTLHWAHHFRTLDPSRPHVAVGSLDEELVDRIPVVHLEDDEPSGAETIDRPEGDRVTNLDVVLHGPSITFPL